LKLLTTVIFGRHCFVNFQSKSADFDENYTKG